MVSCRSCNLGSPRGFQSLAASLSFRTGQNFPPSLSTSGCVAGRLPGRAGGLGTEVACSPWPGGELEAWACVIQSSFSEPLLFFCFCFFLFSWISCPPHLKVSYLKVQMCSSAPGRVLGPCWGLSECLKQEAGGGGSGRGGPCFLTKGHRTGSTQGSLNTIGVCGARREGCNFRPLEGVD